MREITAKAIMERINRIEEALQDDTAAENRDRLLREMEIRQQMRVGHARRMLALGVDVGIVNKVTDLRVEYIEGLRDTAE